jgi:hypothetical protein
MSEAVPPIGEEPLLAIQQQIHDLHDELRDGSPFVDNRFNAPAALAAPFRTELARSAIGDLLVAYGEVLQPDMERASGYRVRAIRPGLNAELMGVSFGSYGDFTERSRVVSRDRAEEVEARSDVRLLPLSDDEKLRVQIRGKYDWYGRVHVTFWYFQHLVRGMQPVGERLSVVVPPYSPGELPDLESSVVITPTPEDGPTAWLRSERPARNEDEAFLIVDTVRRLKAAADVAASS